MYILAFANSKNLLQEKTSYATEVKENMTMPHEATTSYNPIYSTGYTQAPTPLYKKESITSPECAGFETIEDHDEESQNIYSTETAENTHERNKRSTNKNKTSKKRNSAIASKNTRAVPEKSLNYTKINKIQEDRPLTMRNMLEYIKSSQECAYTPEKTIIYQSIIAIPNEFSSWYGFTIKEMVHPDPSMPAIKNYSFLNDDIGSSTIQMKFDKNLKDNTKNCSSVVINEDRRYKYEHGHILVDTLFKNAGIVSFYSTSHDYILHKIKGSNDLILTIIDAFNTDHVFPFAVSLLIKANGSEAAAYYEVSAKKNSKKTVIKVNTNSETVYVLNWAKVENQNLLICNSPVFVTSRQSKNRQLKSNLVHISTEIVTHTPTNAKMHSSEFIQTSNIAIKTKLAFDPKTTLIMESYNPTAPLSFSKKTPKIYFVQISRNINSINIVSICSYTPLVNDFKESPIEHRFSQEPIKPDGTITATIYQRLSGQLSYIKESSQEDIWTAVKTYINKIYAKRDPNSSDPYPEVSGLRIISKDDLKMASQTRMRRLNIYKSLRQIKEYSFLLEIYKNNPNITQKNPFRDNINPNAMNRKHLTVMASILGDSSYNQTSYSSKSSMIKGQLNFPHTDYYKSLFKQYSIGVSNIRKYKEINFKKAGLPLYADKMIFYLTDERDTYSPGIASWTDILSYRQITLQDEPSEDNINLKIDTSKMYMNLISVHLSYKLMHIVSGMLDLNGIDNSYAIMNMHKSDSATYLNLRKPYTISFLSLAQKVFDSKYNAFNEFVYSLNQTLAAYSFDNLSGFISKTILDESLDEKNIVNHTIDSNSNNDNTPSNSAVNEMLIVDRLITIIKKSIHIMDDFTNQYLTPLSSVTNTLTSPEYTMEIQKLLHMKKSLSNNILESYILTANNWDITQNIRNVINNTIIPLQNNLFIITNGVLNLISKDIYKRLDATDGSQDAAIHDFIKISSEWTFSEWQRKVKDYTSTIKIFNYLQANILDHNYQINGKEIIQKTTSHFIKLALHASIGKNPFYAWKPIEVAELDPKHLQNSRYRRDTLESLRMVSNTYTDSLSMFIKNAFNQILSHNECSGYLNDETNKLISQYMNNTDYKSGKSIKVSEFKLFPAEVDISKGVTSILQQQINNTILLYLSEDLLAQVASSSMASSSFMSVFTKQKKNEITLRYDEMNKIIPVVLHSQLILAGKLHNIKHKTSNNSTALANSQMMYDETKDSAVKMFSNIAFSEFSEQIYITKTSPLYKKYQKKIENLLIDLYATYKTEILALFSNRPAINTENCTAKMSAEHCKNLYINNLSILSRIESSIDKIKSIEENEDFKKNGNKAIRRQNLNKKINEFNEKYKERMSSTTKKDVFLTELNTLIAKTSKEIRSLLMFMYLMEIKAMGETHNLMKKKNRCSQTAFDIYQKNGPTDSSQSNGNKNRAATHLLSTIIH
ncbi:hypothetical protein NEPAR06_1323 [Nematocida parisii]|nr:hypothetical protein NEPAR07_1406 [Nematocida parisii]KAI5154715.1 hypothetical protein NEPAR06_1323 [Nematocida parisii]KAI5157653.1 hypothetical protein NEPAR05_1470 [Nematocida parisii]